MSTLQTTNIKNPAGISTNIALDTSGGVVISGVTTVSSGSASAPAITPTGDSNTGIFFPTADTIAFSEGGVEAARFDSSGNIHSGYASNFGSDKVNILASDGGGIAIARDNNGTLSSGLSMGSLSFHSYLNGQTHLNAEAKISAVTAETQSGSTAATDLVFYTKPSGTGPGSSPTERVTITSTGNVNISNGNLVFSTAGKGIDFSATANSSGTMTSELLSDYEQGTWDCRPSTSTSSIVLPSGITSVNFNGTYVKIGSMVYLTGYFESSQSSLDISVVYLRLPFVVDGTTNMWSSTGTETNSWSYPSGVTYVTVRPENGQSYASFKGCGSGIQRVDMTANRIFTTNGVYWIGMMMYRTSS